MRFVIVGCGRMGAGIAQALSRRGHTVAVIDNDAAAFKRLGRAFKGKSVLGHAMERSVLDEAGITTADGLAAVTGNDDLNTVLALLARQDFHVPKVVARLFDPNKAERYRRLGITTIATTTWGIERIVENLLFPNLRVVASLGNNQIDLIELEIPPALAGHALADLASPQEVQAVAVQRRGRTFLATEDMPLESADVLYVAIVAGAVDHLNSQLGIV